MTLTPHSQIIIRGERYNRFLGAVHQITIGVVFENEVGRIEPIHFSVSSVELKLHIPVIKNLTPHNMSTHSPAVLVPLMTKPVVPQKLGIKVMRLKRRMMNVAFRSLKEEKGMVVHKILASIYSREGNDIFTVFIMNDLTFELANNKVTAEKRKFTSLGMRLNLDV